MSQFNQFNVNNLSADQFILRGQRWNLDGANIDGVNTTALTTEVIINDDTKNQALFTEIYSNIHGNTFPVIQAEIDALEANVAILQGNVVSLQSQINVLTGNVVIDEELIAELQRDTQFLEAPYNGLAGNTSYFWRGLQVYNTPTDTAIDEVNGTGIFSYLDGAGPSNQIQLRAADSRAISLKGSTSITAPSGGQVSISGNSQPMTFSVGNNSLNNVEIAMNGNINLKGEGTSIISVYTQPGSVVPPIAAVKRVDIRGQDQTRILGAKTTMTDDGGAKVECDSGFVTSTGNSGGSIQTGKSTRIFAPGGSSPGSIDLQIGTCDLNTVGKINIGTEQGLTEAGYKEIYIGQSGPPSAARKSSTFINGDFYMSYGGIVPPNTGLWDLLLYQGLPTPYSGPTNAPVKTTVNPYFRSISTMCPDFTTNSFFQASGTFSVLVGAGGIIMNTGVGGYSLSAVAGAITMTALIGGFLITTAAGAYQVTTGAGAINFTTGAGPFQVETNTGDVLIKAGYATGSTPELSLGSIYLQARDYSYITPDKAVVIGAGVETPFNTNLINTSSYSFFGNLLSASPANAVISNLFQTPAVASSLINPISANLFYMGNVIGQTGLAQASLFYANGLVFNLSDIATVPYKGNLAGNVLQGNIDFTKFTFTNVELPINANITCRIQPLNTDPNIDMSRYGYGTWQSNTSILSNIGVKLDAYVVPEPPVYDRYLTVLSNVGIQQDLECNANILVKIDALPLFNTTITNNSISTTGNITCQTLNYTYLNPPVASNVNVGVYSIIAGTNVSISPLNGQGNVVINCTLPNVAGVSRVIAGNGIEVSPIGGTGDVTVQLAGSVIPPGGYLPIAGGTMTGAIYQFPNSNIQDNTVKKYRPVTSYQPPFPSIGPPSFTGEMLTFFNGDNSPEQNVFTGWFPQNTFQYEPDIISDKISVVPATFYTSTGGSPTGQMAYVLTQLNQFKVGDHLTSVEISITGFMTIQGQALQILSSDDPNGWNAPDVVALYKIDPGTPPGPYPTTWTIPIDFTYTGGQKAYNFFVIIPFVGYETPGIISTIGYQSGNFTNFQGSIFMTGFATNSYFIGALADQTTSVLYEYFPTTSLNNKLLAVSKASGVARIHGIYSDDSATSRQIIVYGDFENVVKSSGTTVVNNIFMYNIDTDTVIQLTTQTLDPAYAGNLPKGVNGAVWGVEKQISSTASRRVWIWGDMTGVAQMGNPSQPTDCTLTGGCNCTLSDNWAVAIEWDFGYAAGQGPFNCRGGRIINNVIPGSPNDFLLLLYCGGRFSTPNYNSLSMIYYNTVIAPGFLTSPFPFSNGSVTSGIDNAVDYITIVDTSIIMTGEYTGTAQGASATDVPIYSIMRAPIGTFDKNSGQYSTLLYEMANSSNATFWVEGSNQVGVSRIRLMSGGETLVLGTYGYGTPTQGGGVITFNFLDVTVVDTPAVKHTIVATPPYTVLNIANDDPTKVLLGCSLNQNNFWFGQTFNSTIVPTPPTDPTVNAINGAKFAVSNYEMDKIVFSGANQDYNSVSFIAGDVEAGDKYWYWYAQVGLIDYYDGATFYPNISPSGINQAGPTTDSWGQVLLNGNVASKSIDMNNFDIFNANTIFSANILSIRAPNAVEIGEPQRRPATTYTLVINNVAECDQWANFPTATPSYVDGVQLDNPNGVALFDRLSVSVALSYDEGYPYTAQFDCRIYTNIGGVETLLATSQPLTVGQNQSGTYPPTMTSVIFPNDVVIPVITAPDYWFFRFTINGGYSYSYAYVGDISVSPGTVVQTAAVYLKSAPLDDPIDFFNVYGDSFFGNTVLHYANVVCENPLFPNVVSTLNHERLFFDDVIDAYQSYMTSQAMRMINSYIYAEFNSNGLVAYNTIAGTNTQIVPNFVNCSQSGGYSSSLTAQSLTINNSLGGILYNHQVNNSGFESTTTTSTNPSSTIAELTTNGQNALLVLRQIVNPSSSPVSHLFQISQPYSGDCVMSLISSSSPPRNLSMTSQGLISILSGTPSLIGQSTIGAFNNAQMALNQRIILQTQQVDDFTNPTVQIWNNNASISSFPSIKFNKTTTATPAGSTVGAINFYARAADNVSYEWARMSASVRNTTTGNQDGSITMSCLINGAISDFFTFNGADSENNSLKPLDMNGQAFKTSSGNLLISAASSTGVGQIQIDTKPGTLGSGLGLALSGNTLTSPTAGGSSGHHLCLTLPDPTTGLPRVYKIALLNP